MSEAQNDQERPCLHCMMVELIDDFFAQYPTAPAESDKVDTGEADEVIDAIAKIVAELTCRHDATIRQLMIEQLMSEIMKYDGEFRREDAAGAIASHSRHCRRRRVPCGEVDTHWVLLSGTDLCSLML